LDNATNVASGSAAIQGTTKAAVTANDIGADYNVASGTLFTVGSYSSSDVQAKSDSAFSGGASREIVAVSKDDLSILEKDLTSDLLEKGKTQLAEKTDENEMLIPEAAVATASSRTFSQKVGDEATNVKLTMKADVSSISVAKQQLYDLARELIKSQVPDGYTVSDDQININFSSKPTAVTGSATKFDVDFIVNLLPQVKTDVISQKIAGRNMTFAQNYLSTIGGFQKAEIQLHPSLPGPLKTLPHIAKKISVEVSSTP
jgi:hypothetical protein